MTRAAFKITAHRLATLQAVADHGVIEDDMVHGRYDESRELLDTLAGLGIEYDDVVGVLEKEGVEKFVKSWDELVETVRTALEGAGSSEAK